MSCGSAHSGLAFRWQIRDFNFHDPNPVNIPSDDFGKKRDTASAKDDAAIGRALRWSIAALVLVVAATLFLLMKGTPLHLDETGPDASPASIPGMPRLTFKDITASSGITFRHRNGARGGKFLPETMGGGCAFLDFDGDGDQDILFVSSTDWPWDSADAKRSNALTLYSNDGTGRFTDATATSGLDLDAYGMGAAVGDFDNDGRPDVFITGVGGSHLFHNDGGKFRDVTAAAGVGGTSEDWTTSAAWLDIDNDGDLDLFVANYVHWSKDIDIAIDYKLPGIGRAYGPPMSFPGTYPCLYRNDGGGHFTDISAASGIQIKNKATGLPLAKSLGLAPIDIDSDGWIDLIVANDTVQNFVFHNEHNGTFKEI